MCYIIKKKKYLEMPGIEPGAFHMQSERSTTEPHPPHMWINITIVFYPFTLGNDVTDVKIR